ncbi:hypothetical protein ABT56_05730 [Photobacterium aquae]|uniref:GTP-binding protein n=1 Tax=Photobacterium aquae TaxID=1195763 RepID=A0A0J1JXN8_9GAMM|nr:DUF465 domain-containing protein [Photobacterium aquae]KLV07062.1 hypothetical protein ABT56_05730 [Photobacterium aquae]
MLGESHSLNVEFPEHQDRIQELKSSNEHFKLMADRYHHLDHKIRGLECSNVPTDDQHFTQLKLERLQLKDQIFSILSN